MSTTTFFVELEYDINEATELAARDNSWYAFDRGFTSTMVQNRDKPA